MDDDLRKLRQESAGRLRAVRQNMGVSQEKFAEYLDISLSAYKKLECGENGLSVNILRRLREKFNMSTDYLLYGDYKTINDAMEIIHNCNEEDKMKIFLRLAKYFTHDKKKIFVDTECDEDLKKIADNDDLLSN